MKSTIREDLIHEVRTFHAEIYGFQRRTKLLSMELGPILQKLRPLGNSLQLKDITDLLEPISHNKIGPFLRALELFQSAMTKNNPDEKAEKRFAEELGRYIGKLEKVQEHLHEMAKGHDPNVIAFKKPPLAARYLQLVDAYLEKCTAFTKRFPALCREFSSLPIPEEKPKRRSRRDAPELHIIDADGNRRKVGGFGLPGFTPPGGGGGNGGRGA